MKILAVKKRNVFMRSFGVNHWDVTVERANGVVETKACWGSVSAPNAESLMHGIEQEFGEDVFMRYIRKEYVEGQEIVELVVEGKTTHKVNNGNIILHVNTQQNADAITQNLRNQAQNAKSTGIRYGK